MLPRGMQGIAHRPRERVALPGPINRDQRDAIGGFIVDFALVHDRPFRSGESLLGQVLAPAPPR